MKRVDRRFYIFVLISLVISSLACGLTGQSQSEPTHVPTLPETEEPAQAPYPPEPLTVTEPGGAELTIAVGALSGEGQVAIEDLGAGVPFSGDSPLSSASTEYSVDFGGAQQIGQIRMTVPLSGETKVSASDTKQAYMVWAESPGGPPSVVGAHVVEQGIQFPIIGAGKYQVFQLVSHEALLAALGLHAPLTVPTYPQMTSSWCSPTALTDLVNYHQGSWPVGGFGAVWGESSNWYLAGKAGQPFNKGYFFHQLLGAGGYTVPADVKQSFSNGNAEVIIWNWNAALTINLNPFDPNFGVYYDLDFADDLFDAFQAYVESFVWGANGPARPLAWGSSLAGHSRVITGSSGDEYYFNNPSSGSLNDSKTWAAYRQEVLNSFSGPKIEVIDTVVLYAQPQPTSQRRGVLWLVPSRDDGFAGSVALIDGASGMPATNWVWDGALNHDNGYYYQDLRGVLPSDPVFDVQFKALDHQDRVEYGFALFNISGAARDFHVDVVLQNENLSVLKNVGMFDMSVPAETRINHYAGDGFKLFGLPPGLFTLKFVLLQNGLYQDVKYVQFRVSENDLPEIDITAILVQNAFCRKGPDPVFDDVTAFEVGTMLKLLGYNPERTWGKFEKMIGEIAVQCWVSLPAVQITGGEDAPILAGPPLPLPTATSGPVCVSTLDRTACNAADGIFIPGDEPYCQCP